MTQHAPMRNYALLLLASTLLSACGGGGASGATTAPPAGTNNAPTISGAAASATELVSYGFTPTASDPDGNSLTFSISGKPDWLDFNTATGALSGTPGAQDLGQHDNIVISVSDGKLSADLSFSIMVNSDALEQALRTGDAIAITDVTMIEDALSANFETATSQYNAARQKLFGLSASGAITADSLSNINWDPTHDAALLKASFGFNTPVLISNDVTKEGHQNESATLAIIGETPGSRYLVMGSNPLRGVKRGHDVSADMESFMKNSLSWLTSRDDLTDKAFNVVIAQTALNHYFPDQTANREWLTANYGDSIAYNDALSCNGDALPDCITADTDLLIISNHLEAGQDAKQIANDVKAAMEQGTPVLYMHVDGANTALSKALLPEFNVAFDYDNYWHRQRVTAIDPGAQYGKLPTKISEIKGLLDKLTADDFTFTLGECHNHLCPDTSSYGREFLTPAVSLRSRFSWLDARKLRIFDSPNYRYEKLLVLLADMYRRDVVYPMDKSATPRAQFLKSLLADHIVYNGRDIAPVQADMGNFSRSDFSHITPTTKTVNLVARPSARSAGVYAIPGQNFTVRRTDTSDVQTYIYINTVRAGATHLFEGYGYKRPKYLESTRIEITPGTSLSLTSVHGGTVQVGFSAKDMDVSFDFENIGLHPYWRTSADDATFTAAMAAKDYDWAELATSAFEVHSTTVKMQKTIDDNKWGSASAVAAGATRYMSNLPHVLAGFKGVGIDVVDEIHDFASDNGIEIYTLDKVKHMNADQASCGYGCSGNPYDAYWAYDPIGHGDIHELGHGLEKGRMLFTGWVGHALTNPYSYYAKSIYGKDTGADLSVLDCQSLPFENLFTLLQQSRNEADPFAHMQANKTFSWDESVAMTVQMMMASQDEGILENGWHLLARLHVIERAYSTAYNNDADWLAARAGLGFDGYSRNEARAMSKDDFMLIALSHATGRDMRAFLTTYGIGFSDMARDHVAAKNLTSMPVQFFMADKNNYCLGLDKPALPIDGAQVWP